MDDGSRGGCTSNHVGGNTTASLTVHTGCKCQQHLVMAAAVFQVSHSHHKSLNRYMMQSVAEN